MESLGINTENIYKFICTISLLLTVYCFSFDTIILEPHNLKATEFNLQKAEIASELGYLKGVSLDLAEQIKDSTRFGEVKYFYYSKDTTEFIRYYSSLNTTSTAKKVIDSLNKVNRDYGKFVFKSKAISDSQKILEENLNTGKWIFRSLGTLALISFLISLIIWYKNRKEFDKKLY